MGRKLAILLILLLLVGLALAQTTINGSRSITGYWNAGGALWTIPFTLGTATPATCQLGEVFFDTDAAAGQNVYLCTATDTWTAVGGSGTGDMSTSTYDPGTDGTVDSAASAGTAGTAGALSVDGTNCSAGQAPLGVDAAGNAQDCWTPSTGGASPAGSAGNVQYNLDGTALGAEAALTYDSTTNVLTSGKVTISDTCTLGGSTTLAGGTLCWGGAYGLLASDGSNWYTANWSQNASGEIWYSGSSYEPTSSTDFAYVSPVLSVPTIKPTTSIRGTASNVINLDPDSDGTIESNFDASGNFSGNAASATTAANYLPLAGGTLTGNLVLSGDASEGASGGGLTDCDTAASSKLLWSSETNKFSCGTDQTAAGGGDEVSVDSTATTNPDFQDGGDIDFTYNAGVVTAVVKAESVQQGDLDWDNTTARTESQCVQIGASASTFKAGSCGGGAQNLWLTIDTSSGTDITADNTQDTMVLSGGTGISVTGDGTNTVTIASTVTDTDDQPLWLTINTSSGTDVTADDSADTLNLTGGTGITITGDGTATVTIASTITDTGDELTVDDTATATPDLTDDASSDIDFSYNATSKNITAVVKANSVALGTDTTGNYAGSSAEAGVATSALALDSDGDGTIEVQTASTAFTVDPDENGTAELTIDASGNSFSWDINNDGTSEFSYDSDATAKPYFCMDPDDNGNCDFIFVDEGTDATPQVGIRFHGAAKPTIMHDENAKTFVIDNDEDGTYEFNLDGSAVQLLLDPNSDGTTDMLLNQTFLQTDQVRYSTESAARMTATNGRMHMCGGNQFAPSAAAGACMSLGGSTGTYATTIYFDPDGDGTSESNISSTGAFSGNAGTATALAANGGNCSAGSAPLGVDASGAVESCFAVTTASSTDSFTNKTYDAAATGNVFTIEDGTGVSASSAGQIKIDTTANQLVYYGGAAKVYDPRQTLAATLMAPADADTPLIFKAPYGMTITQIDCIVGAATSAVITMQVCNSSGASCGNIEGAITCDTDGAADDDTFTDSSIAAGEWIKMDIGAVTGTVGFVSMTMQYTIVQE